MILLSQRCGCWVCLRFICFCPGAKFFCNSYLPLNWKWITERWAWTGAEDRGWINGGKKISVGCTLASKPVDLKSTPLSHMKIGIGAYLGITLKDLILSLLKSNMFCPCWLCSAVLCCTGEWQLVCEWEKQIGQPGEWQSMVQTRRLAKCSKTCCYFISIRERTKHFVLFVQFHLLWIDKHQLHKH